MHKLYPNLIQNQCSSTPLHCTSRRQDAALAFSLCASRVIVMWDSPTTRSDGASLWSNSTEPQLFPSGTGNTVGMRYTPTVTLCKFLALGRLRWTVREGALGEKAATLSYCESEACPMTHLARRCCLRASLNLRPKSLFSSNPQCTTSTRNSSV